MKVRNTLSAIRPGVGHQPKAAVGDALLRSQTRRRDPDAMHQPGVGLGDLAQGRQVMPRDDQEMDGSLRVDILNGNEVIVLIDPLGGNLAGDDPAKETVGHFGTLRTVTLRTVRSSFRFPPALIAKSHPHVLAKFASVIIKVYVTQPGFASTHCQRVNR